MRREELARGVASRDQETMAGGEKGLSRQVSSIGSPSSTVTASGVMEGVALTMQYKTAQT